MNQTIRQLVRVKSLCCVLAISCGASAACGDDDQGGSAEQPQAGSGSGGKGNSSGSAGSGGASAGKGAGGKGAGGAAGHAAAGSGGAHAGSGGQVAGSPADSDAGTSDDAGAAVSNFEITLSTGPCFGACPEYDVTIDQTGSVTFDGHQNTKQSGKANQQVPAADAAAVYDALIAADYWNLHASYRTEADGCARVATDHPTYTWTVTAQGKQSKMVEDYLGCMDAPGLDKLRAAETLVVDKAGIADWIGPNK